MSEFQIVDEAVSILIDKMPEYKDRIFFWRVMLDNGDIIIRLENSNLNAVINQQGAFKLGFDYEFCNAFIDGLMQIKKDGKYGFIDEDYKIVIPAIYDYLSFFTNGFAKGRIGKMMYFIDINNIRTVNKYEHDFKKVRKDYDKTFKIRNHQN